MATTMISAESSAGLVSCACWDDHATLKIKNCGISLLLMAAFFTIGIITPYLTIIIRKSMQAFLPFISQAAGEPPAHGLFTIFEQLGVFFGLWAVTALFISINQRNIKNNTIIRNLNVVAFLLIIVGGLGLIITSVFPVGYVDVPNKFEYLLTVAYEHSVGATLILIGQVLYQYLLMGIWWLLPDTSTKDKYVKIGFGVAYVLLFLLCVYPLPAYILQEFGPNIFNFKLMKTLQYDFPRKYNTIYMICSVCEWMVVILTIINLTSLYKDLKNVSFRVVFRHKSCLAEDIEDVKRISLKIIS